MDPTETTADSLPCIWMSAGLLSYRLCDREYDCEHCPLDAALRGAPPPPPADRVRLGDIVAGSGAVGNAGLTDHDLRRFRRRVAFELLAAAADGDDVGATLPDGGEPVLDLPSLLGPRRYLALLHELVPGGQHEPAAE